MGRDPDAGPSHLGLDSLGNAGTNDRSGAPTARLRDALAPGALLAGRYRIERFLARGGMGEVHEAHDELLDVALALKTLRLDLEGDPVRLKRFKRELLLARSITHPNVCRVYDLEVDRSTRRVLFFLTMELLAGETLRSRILARGRMSPGEALPLLRQMTTALGAAHAAGIVHRDFKSANVMLVPASGGERVVITDFGLAHAADADAPSSLAEMDSIAGTPAYIAPEQVRGEHTGPAADLYALGVVLFEMTTGALPFPEATSLEALERLGDAPSPRTLVPDLDRRWEEAILRLLRKDPRDRFVHAADVVRALEGGSVPVAPRDNLPAERDAFVGREAELADLSRRVDGGSRLLTLVGAGGSGKTRLARRFGRTALGRFPGGVWFVDLCEARDLAGIVRAVAMALDVPLGREDPAVQLGRVLAARGRALVVLDNYEQVLDQAEATLGKWLEGAPDVTFLATSRERLKLTGEEVVPIEPLAIGTEGVRLFEVRARAQRPDFAVTDANRAVVTEVVRLVDGLPLAIELLAARARVLRPEALLDRLGDRFRLLTGGAGRSPRQATLRAALDWSWDLLQPWEKGALAQVTVFEGGFTLEAAEDVIDLAHWPDAPPALDIIQALVDKSLLRTITSAVEGRSRFGLLVSIHGYAAEKLATDGAVPGGESGAPVLRAAVERHGRYFARHGSEEALEALQRHGGGDRRRLLTADLDNLVAACRRAVERGDARTAVPALVAAWAVLRLRGPFALGLELGRAVTGLPGLGPGARAIASSALGQACGAHGLMDEARAGHEIALAIHRETGNLRAEGGALGDLGGLHKDQGRMNEARHCYEAALAIHRDAGNRSSEGGTINNLGNIELAHGRIDEARLRYEAALAIHREVGNAMFEGITLCNLGIVHQSQGREDVAQALMETALAIHRRVGNRRFEAVTLGHLGDLHPARGRLDEARACHEASLAIHREVGDRDGEGKALGSLGRVHAEQGRADEARASYEAAVRLLREVGDARSEGQVTGNLGILHLDQGRLDEARACFESALAIHREVGDRRFEGLVVRNMGLLHLAEGRPDEARACHDAALGILREVGHPADEATVLGSVGMLHAGAGRIDDARTALVAGEARLRDAQAWLELAKLLCQRTEVEILAADSEAAVRALTEAEALSARMNVLPASDLGRDLVRIRRELGPAPG